MLDRVSIFSNPEIVEHLRERFIPLAVDAWYGNRKKDAEGEFYRKVVRQHPSKRGGGSTQGRYIFTPDGTLIGYNNNRSLDRVRRMIRQALEKFKPGGEVSIEKGEPQKYYDRRIREGMVVVDVNAKVLGGYDETENRWHRIFQKAVGEDHLWILKEEAAALARNEIPDALKRRLARYHFNDFTRGEPNMWRRNEIRKLDLKLAEGKLTGSVHLETDSGDRGYTADVLGFVEAKDGKITRFDVVAKGTFWGHGRYTGNAAPKGKFPLAVAFRLADPSKASYQVPPQGSRDIHGYLR